MYDRAVMHAAAGGEHPMTQEQHPAPAMSGRPSIRDVARAAGTAVSTVSRALNGHPDVAEEKRARILAIAAALGYRQHAFARGLIRGRTSLLAVVANEFNPFNGEYHTQLLQGLAATARQQAFELLLSFPAAPDGVLATCHSLHQRGIVDGAVVVSPALGDDADLAALQAAGFPLVVVNPGAPQPGLTSIAPDNLAGANAATRYLADLGHQRIALLDYLTGYSAGRDRRAGYEQALRAQGLSLDPVLIAAEEAAPVALGRWFGAAPPPTAILCFNDQLAYAVIGELAAHGRAVPRDVAVVGFGDLPTAAHFGPGLTTVHQPIAELGQRAAQLLVDLIAGVAQPGTHEQMPTALVVRGSTGPRSIVDRQ
jgi:DNA-binding LacI/PurR family transcriptional regulator